MRAKAISPAPKDESQIENEQIFPIEVPTLTCLMYQIKPLEATT
jgi:hypothetical protein